MVRCQCLKIDGMQCSRDGSSKTGQNPNYCYQHQNCKLNITQKKPAKIPLKKKPTQSKQPVQKKIPVQKEQAVEKK